LRPSESKKDLAIYQSASTNINHRLCSPIKLKQLNKDTKMADTNDEKDETEENHHSPIRRPANKDQAEPEACSHQSLTPKNI